MAVVGRLGAGVAPSLAGAGRSLLPARAFEGVPRVWKIVGSLLQFFPLGSANPRRISYLFPRASVPRSPGAHAPAEKGMREATVTQRTEGTRSIALRLWCGECSLNRALHLPGGGKSGGALRSREPVSRSIRADITPRSERHAAKDHGAIEHCAPILPYPNPCRRIFFFLRRT